MRQHYIVRLSSLGDIVLCSGFVRAVKNLYTGEDIYFSCLERFAPIIESFSQKTQVLPIKNSTLVSVFKEGLQIGRKSEAPECVIYDLQGNLRSKFFILGLRAGFNKRKSSVKILKSPRHSFLRNLSVFLRRDLIGQRFVYVDHQSLLGIPKSSALSPQLITSALQSTDKRFKLLVAPDAHHWKKRWPESYWCKLVQEILTNDKNISLTLVGSEKCFSTNFISDFQNRFPDRVTNLLGSTSLADLSKIASQHSLTICGNSAWLHISEASGTPTLSLAGPIVSGFGFSPWDVRSRELSVELNCRPCTKHGGGVCYQAGKNYHACMTGISVEQVRSVIKEMCG